MEPIKAPAAESPANLRRHTSGAAGGTIGLGFPIPSSVSDSSSGFGFAAIAIPLPSLALSLPYLFVLPFCAQPVRFAGGYSLVLVFDNLARRNLIEQSLSRKIVHVLSGICYMATWPIFSSSSGARYFAAVVPLLNCIRLLIYGLSIVPNESVIKSVTREGKPEELLRGPLYYVLVLMFSSLIFWRESPIGIISLAMMSGGDGFADILGRRFGSMKLPYNKRKSWIGSISMFMFGFIFSTMMLHYFSAFGYLHLDWGSTVEKLLVVSLAASFMESLPISEVIDDNITVPLTSMAAAFMVFGY